MSAAASSSANRGAWRVGLTGGIASGKTTVSKMFGALGVPIIDADVIAREVVAPGTTLLERIFERFGSDLRQADGSLDRAALRRRIFADAKERRDLEALVQPAIGARSEQLAASAAGPYLIYVIPLLVETHASSRFNRVLVVDCPEELQLERLQARDGCHLAQAQAMLATQASRKERLGAANDVILNDGTTASLESDVLSLHERYLILAGAAGQDVYAQ
jgi:dephospho-CoA kinase